MGWVNKVVVQCIGSFVSLLIYEVRYLSVGSLMKEISPSALNLRVLPIYLSGSLVLSRSARMALRSLEACPSCLSRSPLS